MKRGMIDFWVGLFIVAGLCAILFLALKVSSKGSVHSFSSYQLIANFDNAGSLKVRAPVKCAGVVVGQVVHIELDTRRYVAKVRMSIYEGYQFSKDSSAEILTAGLLGEQYIGITPGSDTQSLSEGDSFKITSSAIVLEHLIGQFLFSKASKN